MYLTGCNVYSYPYTVSSRGGCILGEGLYLTGELYVAVILLLLIQIGRSIYINWYIVYWGQVVDLYKLV